MPGFSRLGQVVELGEEAAVVAVGPLRVEIPRSRLTPADGEASERSRVELVAGPAAPPPAEIHLRGLTVDEALGRLESYLDDAYLAGLESVRVVHGRGTGTLRRAVWEFLGRHPLVSGFRPAEEFAGGDGVTVVELAVRPEIARRR